MDEGTVKRRRLHSETLTDLYSPPNIILLIKSRMRWTGHVARMWGEVYTGFLVGRHDGKRPLGRPTHKSEHNIKTDLQEMGWRTWTGLLCLR